MPLELSPLDEAALAPAVRKVASATAPPQLRLMAARGMAPLPPQELAVAIYQIAVTSDGELRDSANKTARELPDGLLSAALPTPLDPRVLDFYARALLQRSKALQPLLKNAATADETFAWLAAAGGEALAEQVAQNEMRLLRCPAIITALYLNPKARLSTAQRAIELAIRNGVEVQGIHAIEEIKAAIQSEGVSVDEATESAFAGVLAAAERDAPAEANELPPDADDEARAAAAAAAADALGEAAHKDGADAPENPDNVVQYGKLSMAAKLRLAALGNVFARAMLVRDRNRVVAMAAVKHPGVNEHEAERFAANRALHEDVIRYIASQRNFTKRYSVKINLVNNPKCPLQVAMTMLGHLTPRDLRMVARSKGIPSALAKAAQGLLAKREQH